MAVAFFVLSLIGGTLTLNALKPLHHHLGPLRRATPLDIPVFFTGWLTSELPYHSLAVSSAITAVFVALGALHEIWGILGLVISVASWVGLVFVARRAEEARAVLEAALREGLGHAMGPPTSRSRSGPSWRQIAMPFPMRDRTVTRLRDIPYGEDAAPGHRLDIYRPRVALDARQALPVFFYLHGGAWTIGFRRAQGIPIMLRLASHGWLCVSADYRLSPKARWPDHLLDVRSALAWVRVHAAEYGGDPSVIIVAGSSAGGHLAALLALDAQQAVQGAVLFYGVYDLTNRMGLRGPGFVGFLERTVFPEKLTDAPEVWAAASPMDLVHAGTPPMMIVHGTNDTLVPPGEARQFADLIRTAGAGPVVYAEVPGAQHAFDLFPSVRSLALVDAVEGFCEQVYAQDIEDQAQA